MTVRLPADIPAEEYPAPEVFLDEALALVEEAGRKGLVLRVMGGMAIYMHSRDYEALWKGLARLGTKAFTDIDFVAYGRQRNQLMEFVTSKGYKTDPRFLYQFGKSRHIFFGGRVPMVEIFYDELAMNHTIPYAGRLEKDSPTVPLGELMMQKLQIVKINEKDIKDLIVLLRAHDVGEGDDQKVNLSVLDSVDLFNDWGWYHTATTNLAKLKAKLAEYPQLSDEDRAVVSQRIDRILAHAESRPKSFKWKMRAKVGTKTMWYNPVDDW
ncbi:MAG: hypothetical protein AB1793_00340 [Candidatus Thermoplasmatota archaeon]